MNFKQKTLDKFILAEKEYLETDIGIVDIAKKYNFGQNNFSNWLKERGHRVQRKRKFNEDIFNLINTEEKAYWLGFLYADGCVRKNPDKYVHMVEVRLAALDKNHLEKFDLFTGTRRKPYYDKKRNCYHSQISSKYMSQDLINKGCIPQKTFNIKFPTEDQVPSHLIRHFIRGYFDGDGCISISSKGTFSISFAGTKHFLNGIIKYYDLREIDSKRSGNIFILSLRLNYANFILSDLYRDSNIFLERKYEKFLKFKEYLANANPKWSDMDYILTHNRKIKALTI